MTDALSFLIDPLRAILEFFHGLGLSWGLSIVMLTVVVRLALIPLTVKQYTSMRAMQRLQPKIKALQKKYKDDRQKLNEEMMKFYREHQVNPFGSCLPLLLQMPIFFAIFLMIRSQPFEGDIRFLWISNINLEVLNWEYALLVILFMGSQLLSSWLMGASAERSQQMVMYVMPIGFGIFFLISPFPAALLIYWVTTNLWTIGQQVIVKKIVVAKEAAEEAARPPEPEKAKKKKKVASKGQPVKKGKKPPPGKGKKKVKPGTAKKTVKTGAKTGGKSGAKPRPKKK